MNEKTVKVNFHTHSSVSDGTLTPEQLAAALAARGVSFAALTDHDTVSGLSRFRETLTRLGVGCVDGIELSVQTSLGIAHLLAYGMDIDNPDFMALFRQFTLNGQRVSTIPDIREALSIVHRAGGAAFLAHPLHLARDMQKLDALCGELKPAGLDGLEAIYSVYTEAEQSTLTALADRHGLAVSAGGDFHGEEISGQKAVVLMSESRWLAFREVLFFRARKPSDSSTETRVTAGRKPARLALPGKTVARIIVPALTTILLFIISFFFLMVPYVEDMLLDRKKETIRDLTHSAMSILTEYDALAKSGSMGLEEAQREAVERLRDLRYGSANKDYFWITDMVPRMIMHPYRSELEGTDLTDFRDAAGHAVFVEFVKAVREKEEGYVEYFWQWEDDRNRIVPKLSFVRRFAPWDWEIGTGIYLEDVNAEIDALSANLVTLCAVISVFLSLLIALMVRQGLAVERHKQAAEDALRESHERYRALADGSTDGTIIVMGESCTFANNSLLAMTGYEAKEIQLLTIQELLDLPDEILMHNSVAASLEKYFTSALGVGKPTTIECPLRTRSGEKLPVIVSGTPFAMGYHQGLVLSVKDIGSQLQTSESGNSKTAALARHIEELTVHLQSKSLWLRESVFSVSKEVAFCRTGDTLEKAAAAIRDSTGETAIVLDADGHELGMLDARSLLDPTVQTAGMAMTAPVMAVDTRCTLIDALAAMRKAAVDRLIIRSLDGKTVGVILASDIATLHSHSVEQQCLEAGSAVSITELSGIIERASATLSFGISSAARGIWPVHDYARIIDAAIQTATEQAIKRLGQPPSQWAFLCLGSLGRKEFLPGSDQDNALVWFPGGANAESERLYFLELGELVCASLEKTGIPLCPAGVMASNPLWNAPLTAWRSRILQDFRESEPERLLDLEILFDFRYCAGSRDLAEELRSFIITTAAAELGVTLLLAQTARTRRLPGQATKQPSERELKELSATLAGFVRLYALKHNLTETGTTARMDALVQKDIFKPGAASDVKAAFESVMLMRGELACRNTAQPIHEIARQTSGGRNTALFGFALEQATLLQKRIGFDFLGSGL